MQIMLRNGITLRQGTFAAVVAPERTILSALNTSPDLDRFLFLFLCGNYSRLASQVGRDSPNFEVRRPFTADQLLTSIRESGHTVIFVEHDLTLFDNAERLLEPVGLAMRDAGHGALMLLYTPAMDRSFAALARHADRLIEIVNPAAEAESRYRTPCCSPRNGRTGTRGQTTLPGT
jgi:DNA polymerase I